MGLKRSIKNIFNSVVGNLPVIGPHATIEADLMLAGSKPFTNAVLWREGIPTPDENPDCPDDIRKEYADLKRMDEAVRQGKLKSLDEPVLLPPNDPSGKPVPLTFRWFYKADKEADLHEFLAADKHWRATGDTSLFKKRHGDYYGYRERDQWLWNKLQTAFPNNKMGLLAGRFLYFINRNITQPAYQGKVLRQIEKEQSKAEKISRRANAKAANVKM